MAEAMVRYGDARAAAALELGEGGTSLVAELLDELHDRKKVSSSLSALDQADLEDNVEGWLADHEVDRSWELAPGLVDAGLTPDRLSDLSQVLGPSQLAKVIGLIGAAQEQLALVHQIEEGTRRMSAIVKALKSYAYLDQAPVQNVEVTDGLDDTLMLLEHKTKDIEVRREYADDLPRIEALGGELNQVWTNLIDNALYAMAESGTTGGRLIVRATPADSKVVVEVEDNGPGIPEEIRTRIFDSFFTTKPPGSGTGLGLDISRTIVIHHHGGNLTVESQPGRTVFRVELPLRLPERAPTPGDETLA